MAIFGLFSKGKKAKKGNSKKAMIDQKNLLLRSKSAKKKSKTCEFC